MTTKPRSTKSSTAKTGSTPDAGSKPRRLRHRNAKRDNINPTDAEDDTILDAAIERANTERQSKARSPSPTHHTRTPTTSSANSPSSEDAAADMSLDVSPEKENRRSINNNTNTPAPSALKQGRYTARPSTPAPERMHLHEHTRIIVEAAYKCEKDDDRFKSFLAALSSLLSYGQMVDEHFTINPVREGGRDKDWSDPNKLPTSMTALGAHLAITSSSRVFEKPRGGPSKEKGKKDSRPDTVYFSFAVSSDIEPAEIMARIAVDWSILGGTRLAVKALNYFDTCTPIAIYFLWNEGHSDTILQELKTILLSVIPVEIGGPIPTLPPLALRKNIPRTPGQVSVDFNNLSLQAQMARRAWHIEVESKHSATLVDLVRKAKDDNAISEMWGRQVHFSEVADNNTPSAEIKRYVKFSQRHVNFHCSMTCEDIKGITNLDATAQIFSITSNESVGQLSLRQVLLKYMKMSDGHSLIAEIHQRGPMGLVEVIIPNTAEAESMILMMNRHFPAFCYHYLTTHAGMGDVFVKALLKDACCPTLFATINQCQWDAATNSITTEEQVEEERRMAEFEKAAWYRDEFGKHMVTNLKKVKKYTDPEALYDLDGERSVKTLNARNDPKTVDLVNVEEEDEDDDEMDEEYSDESSGSSGSSAIPDFTLDDLDFSDIEDDTNLDSASNSVNGKPPGEAADTGTGTSKVRWSTTSSVDESAPSPAAGSG
jgi:hypothetical protein